MFASFRVCQNHLLVGTNTEDIALSSQRHLLPANQLLCLVGCCHTRNPTVDERSAIRATHAREWRGLFSIFLSRLVATNGVYAQAQSLTKDSQQVEPRPQRRRRTHYHQDPDDVSI